MRLRHLSAFALPTAAALLVGVLLGTYVVGPFFGQAPTRAGTGSPSPAATAAAPSGDVESSTARPSAGASGKPVKIAGSPKPAATAAPAATVTRAPEGVVPILYYHRVEAVPAGFASWSKASRDAFLVDDLMPYALIAQLDWLKSHGYTTILPRDLAAHWDQGRPLPKRPVILTFDDGFKGWRTFVLPELQKRRMVAEFYVTLANLGRSISWDDVTTLAKAGMGIGGHDVQHVQIAGAGIVTSPGVMQYQVAEAKRQLEARTGVIVDSMAYVGGGWSPALARIVARAGYTSARSIERGVQQTKAIRYHLHVSRVSWKDDVTDIYKGTMVSGLPMFAKRVSGENPG